VIITTRKQIRIRKQIAGAI